MAARSPGLSGRLWALVLALHLLPFASRPALIGGDEPHYALMAHSLAVDLDIDLADDYEAVARGSSAAGRRWAGRRLEPHWMEFDGRRVFSHPLGLPLLAAPLLAAQQAVLPGSAPDVPLALLTLAVTFAALAAGVRLLGELAGDAWCGALAGLALYFSTPLWFYSRTFFTEPYVWSFAVLAVALLARRRELAAGLLLGAALAVKETSVLLVLPIALAVWRLRGGAALARTAAGPAAVAVLWMVKNLAVYGKPLQTFQTFRLGDPLRGAVGLLVDPASGLLWFAPLAAAAAAAGWAAAGRRPAVRDAALVAAAAWFALAASWIDWQGGSGYGPRLLVPALPALAVPLAALLAAPRRAVRLLAAALFVAGFTVQGVAASDPFDAFWNAPAAALVAERPLAAAVAAALGLGLVALGRRGAGAGGGTAR